MAEIWAFENSNIEFLIENFSKVKYTHVLQVGTMLFSNVIASPVLELSTFSLDEKWPKLSIFYTFLL